MAEGWLEVSGNRAVTDVTTDHPNIKLHIGAPGAAGTSNPAVETDREAATFGTAAGGIRSNTGDLEWVSVAESEDYTHFTGWDDPTTGAPGYSGTIVANAVTAGDTFTIPEGDLDVSVPLAS
jgi:hypothetical protein